MNTATPNTTPAPPGAANTDQGDRTEATTVAEVSPLEPAHLLAPAEDRGQTTIQDRVIEAMATRIVSEEPGVGGAARRFLGVPVTSEDADRAPRVEATVTGELVSLRARLSVAYPAPVHTLTDQLRHRLIDRIGALTGKRVGVVDIVVVALHRPDNSGRVVE
jgi:uncharacterized alkaline shock family protein YloU